MMRTGFSGYLVWAWDGPMLASTAQNAAMAARLARMLLEISRLIVFLPIMQLLFDFLAGSLENPAAPVYSDFPLAAILKTSYTTYSSPDDRGFRAFVAISIIYP
jgi:hypothetical protein